MILRVAAIYTALLLLTTYSPAVKGRLMIGYSGFNFLPFADGGLLEFQVGEDLWAVSLEENSQVILISPKGDEYVKIIGTSPKLLKTFNDRSQTGRWILKTRLGELHILLRDPDHETPLIRYEFSGKKLVARLFNGSRAVFLKPSSSKMILMIAGINNNIRLNRSIPDGEYAGDILLPRRFIYRGMIEGVPYRFESESLVGRVLVKVRDGMASLTLPKLHSVGAGGLLPLRIGEALLRLRLSQKNNLTELIYVLDEKFEDFMGEDVSRSEEIPLTSISNVSLSVLLSSNDNVGVVKLKPPLSILKFYDPDHGSLDNLTIRVENLSSRTLGDTSYILLRKVEFIPVPSHSILGIIDVFVNGFKVKVLTLSLRAGKVVKIPLRLHKLSITLVDPSGNLLRSGMLKINGKSVRVENGSCSYLLPAGVYRLEAKSGKFGGSTTINLSSDTSIKLRLHRIYDIDDLLTLITAAELITLSILALIYVILRSRRAATVYSLHR
ncbi:MAG: hypothetical protein DRN68_05155 [Thaumarchaeota archaeon]|nr:MAG: hypothetical protein DRN68_05155 [Nitrososphaerota archaeon]